DLADRGLESVGEHDHVGLALLRLPLLGLDLIDAQSLDLNHIGLEDLHRVGHLANLVLALETRDGNFGGATCKRRHDLGERAKWPGDRAANPQGAWKQQHTAHHAADDDGEADGSVLAPGRLLYLNGQLPVLLQQFSSIFFRFLEERYGLRRDVDAKLTVTLALVRSRQRFTAPQIFSQLDFSGLGAGNNFLEQIAGRRFPVVLENLRHPLQRV